MISVFVGVGIFLTVYAAVSCKWFVFDNDDIIDATNLEYEIPFSVSVSVSFPPVGANIAAVQSLGLFRYQTGTMMTTTAADDSDVRTPITLTHQCTRYEPLFQSDMTWVFVAQICFLVGPMVALIACLVAMIGANKYATTFLLFVATGVQATSVIFSMSLCETFWECPWLLGSLADVVATGLFFLSWLLAVCGLVRAKYKDVDDSIDRKGDKSLSDHQIKNQMTEDSDETNGDDFRSVLGRMVDGESQIATFDSDNDDETSISLRGQHSKRDNRRRKLFEEDLVEMNDIASSSRCSASHSSRSVKDMITRINSEVYTPQTPTNTPKQVNNSP
jgi:hypothetical protein